VLPHGARKDWAKIPRALLKAIGKESIAVLNCGKWTRSSLEMHM